MPLLKYKNPGDGTWVELSTTGPAGAQGPTGATGPAGPAGPAGGTSPRATATASTVSLLPGAGDTTTIPLAKTYRLLSLQTSKAARVRLYTTVAARTADASRAVGTDPAAYAGVVFEYVTPDTSVYSLAPTVSGASLEATPVTAIPMAVTNNGTTGTVSVSLLWEVLE